MKASLLKDGAVRACKAAMTRPARRVVFYLLLPKNDGSNRGTQKGLGQFVLMCSV